MKKLFLILSAVSALALAGCDKGGTSDAYGTSSGNGSNSMHSGATHTNSNATGNRNTEP